MTPTFIEKLSRAETLCLKKIRRVYKQKELGNPFLRTVKIFSGTLNVNVECKMTLDTGSDLNLITVQTLHDLSMIHDMEPRQGNIAICLNGTPLPSIGTVTLRWKGKRFRKIFTTTFHVIDGDEILWQVILGSQTIIEHGIVKFAGFGGKGIIALPKQTKDERKARKDRQDKHKEEVAANDARVEEDIRARIEAGRRDNSRKGDSSSGRSGSSGKWSHRNDSY